MASAGQSLVLRRPDSVYVRPDDGLTDVIVGDVNQETREPSFGEPCVCPSSKWKPAPENMGRTANAGTVPQAPVVCYGPVAGMHDSLLSNSHMASVAHGSNGDRLGGSAMQHDAARSPDQERRTPAASPPPSSLRISPCPTIDFRLCQSRSAATAARTRDTATRRPLLTCFARPT